MKRTVSRLGLVTLLATLAGGFESALREVADRALRRYPHPDGIPPEILITTDWHSVVRYE